MANRTTRVESIHINDAIDLFMLEIESQDYSARTLSAYRLKLRKLERTYLEFCRENQRVPNVWALSGPDVARYLNSYGTASSRNDAIKPLRLFLRWAVTNKYIDGTDAEPAIKRKTLKTVKRLPLFMPADKFADMLALAGEHSPHDRMVIASAMFTLCRVSEISAITLGDIDLKGSEISVYRSKRKRWTTVVIPPDLHEELDLWLPWYAAKMGFATPMAMMDAHPEWPLLPRVVVRRQRDKRTGLFVVLDQRDPANVTLDPERLGLHLELVVHRVLDQLGYSGRQGSTRKNLGAGMHTLRRSGARALWLYLTNVIGNERALAQVSRQLDHDDLKTTQIYIGLDLEKQELDKFLLTNRMYGDLGKPAVQPGLATVVPLRGPQSHAEPSDSGPTQLPAKAATAL